MSFYDKKRLIDRYDRRRIEQEYDCRVVCDSVRACGLYVSGLLAL